MHLFVNVCMRRWILPRARQCSGAASTSTLSHFHSSFSVCDVDAVQYIRAGSISLCSLSPAQHCTAKSTTAYISAHRLTWQRP